MANNHHPASGSVTFVQADPSNFRTIVQRLTGPSPDPPTNPTRPGSAFKLHERRMRTAKKLEIELNGSSSPVSHFDMFARESPTTLSPVEEEERAIAGKRFYLHPSPRNNMTRGPDPELLPLFPVCSPRVDPDDVS